MNIYQIKITLKYIEPPIWRQMQVTDRTRLGDLHMIIQIVMGWEDCHMHLFNIGNHHNGIPDPDYPSDIRDEDDITLEKVAKSGDELIYEYDFGDGWTHRLKVEKVLPAEQDTVCPVCLEGARACPPEDCGGFPGYMALLEALANPDDEDNAERIEWIGEDYNPEKFDLDKINRELKQ